MFRFRWSYKDVCGKGRKGWKERIGLYICFSPMSDFRESSRKVEVEVENNDQSQGTYDMPQP